MRTAKKTVPTLDLFRLAAVLLVVMNHTSPLADVSAMADFWLTRVLARVAVPFFLMTTGYFLSRNHWAGVGRQLKKLCLLYGVCILLYLPVNLYAGSFTGPADVLRKLLVDGTFYHLWYFPATILGIVIARWLSRLGLRVALPVAALLYLIGLGGDSYYGLVSQIPLLRTLYDGIFTLCGYTRNGLFFAPLFLLLGAAGRRWNQKLSLAGFFLSLAAMSAEGLWLHRMDVQRHDSMYLALPLCIVCLFSLLLGGNKGESRKVREFSTAMYVLHPLCIVRSGGPWAQRPGAAEHIGPGDRADGGGKGGGLRSRRGSDRPHLTASGRPGLCRGLPGRGDCSAKGGHPGDDLDLRLYLPGGSSALDTMASDPDGGGY